MGSSYSQDLEIIRSDLSSGNTELKRNALHQIKLLRTEAASRLAVPMLTDSNEIVRATAVSAVIYLPKGEAATTLIPLLNDKSEFVRQETAFALGELSDISTTNVLTISLLRSLKRDTLSVRSAAIVALGKIGNSAAIEGLTVVLKKKSTEDDEFLRRAAARSIGQIAQIHKSGNVSVVTPQNFLPSKYKEQPRPYSHFLNITPSTIKILSEVLTNQKEADDTRREAAFALGAIDEASAAAILRSYLNSSDIYLAEICKEALIKLGQPQ